LLFFPLSSIMLPQRLSTLNAQQENHKKVLAAGEWKQKQNFAASVKPAISIFPPKARRRVGPYPYME